MESKDIRQAVTFKAGAHEVYELLMDAKKHSALAAGDEVKISRKVGGKFNVGGYVEGVNMELVPDEKIVQSCATRTGRRGTSRWLRSFSRRKAARRK